MVAVQADDSADDSEVVARDYVGQPGYKKALEKKCMADIYAFGILALEMKNAGAAEVGMELPCVSPFPTHMLFAFPLRKARACVN